MQFDCPGCGQPVWADIVDARDEKTMRSRFVYRCPVEACHAPLGPVKRDEPEAPADVPAPQVAPLTFKVTPATSGTGIITQLRGRLTEVEARLAEIEPLKAERAYLRRIIAAADRKPRAPKSNVVPIDRKTAI